MINALPDDGVTAPKHVGAVLVLILMWILKLFLRQSTCASVGELKNLDTFFVCRHFSSKYCALVWDKSFKISNIGLLDLWDIPSHLLRGGCIRSGSVVLTSGRVSRTHPWDFGNCSGLHTRNNVEINWNFSIHNVESAAMVGTSNHQMNTQQKAYLFEL